MNYLIRLNSISPRVKMWAFSLLLVFAAACDVETGIDPTPTLNSPIPTATALDLPPTPTVIPIQKPTPIPSPIPDLVEEVIPLLCSPLEGLNLNELPDIIYKAYEAPPPGKDTGHHGVDFMFYRRGGQETSIGEVPVRAVLGGRVASVVVNRLPYGNMLMLESSYEVLPAGLAAAFGIQPGDSLFHLYAHLVEEPGFGLGEEVKCGDFLGQVGSSGFSDDPHLHFEIRTGPSGATFEGMVFYDTQATVQEMENYTTWRMSGTFVSLDPMKLLLWTP
jgi:murein DD-endopeptidase MepM/ murein hydrolase activator NlpD